MFRYRLSLGLEALLWTATFAWLLFLVFDARQMFVKYDQVPVRDLLEIVLLGLLVFWPIIRTRLRHGYSMRSWDDAPSARDPQPFRPPLPHDPTPR